MLDGKIGRKVKAIVRRSIYDRGQMVETLTQRGVDHFELLEELYVRVLRPVPF
jgi:hypothetical protein